MSSYNIISVVKRKNETRTMFNGNFFAVANALNSVKLSSVTRGQKNMPIPIISL